jgi:hypothetical protein
MNVRLREPDIEELKSQIEAGLDEVGYAHVVGPLDPMTYHRLAERLGEIVGRERVALRPGAHAYLAKPGPVPLHTDQPQVEIIGWLCQEQDAEDGASQLLDSRPVVAALRESEQRMLREVELWTPPLSGGPPTETWPVLRQGPNGNEIFCSPWLRSVSDRQDHIKALAVLRERLSAAAGGCPLIRLAAGEAVFIDNRRVLHGRGRICDDSRRCLLRVWIRHEPETPNSYARSTFNFGSFPGR